MHEESSRRILFKAFFPAAAGVVAGGVSAAYDGSALNVIFVSVASYMIANVGVGVMERFEFLGRERAIISGDSQHLNEEPVLPEMDNDQ